MTAGRLYEFGRFRLDADARLLFRDEKRIALTPKAVDVLLALLEGRGTPVGREELFLRVWSDAVVEDGTLTSHISILRKALGGGEHFIETIPKRGYRFVGAVEETRGRTPAGRVLLAVLPFENLSGSRKHDCFSDGLTEEMITQLGRLNPERLGVIARTSTMTYKSTDKTIERIGRELGVSHVLEGSARRAGARVRISAQLIQVSDQTHLWAENYEGSLEDILSLQSRVSLEVARQIQIRLLAPEQTRLESTKPVVFEAYEAYLKGRYFWHQRTEHDLRQSIRCFQEAIQSDPDYASPYAGMADTYLTLMDHGYLAPREATAKARPAALNALRLDEALAEAHISLGHASLHEFDWPNAEREFLRGIELNPSYSTARFYYANYLVAMGRLPEAVAEAEQAKRLDPVSPAAHSNLASILWHSGQYQQSIEEAQRILEFRPNFSRAYEDLGRAYEQMGALDAAIEAFQRAVSMEEQAHGSLASLAHAYALAGKRDQAIKILEQLHDAANSTFVSAYTFALISVALGKTDEAFAWFDQAYEERSSALPFIRINPRFASLRGDPRFERLLQRVGLN
jgi:TolB-like protein/tetratricopeptide (TPR) repeat protein